MQQSFYTNKYIILFIYIVLVMLIYTQTFHFDFALDDDLIKEGIEGKIFQFTDIFNVFTQRYNRVDYRPISMLTFALEYFIVGTINPQIAHIINVVIFVLILFSTHYLFQLLFNGKYKLETFFIVCIFAVHPLVVEVVANIKSRDGLLSMLLGIWSLYFFLKASYNNYKFKYLVYSWLFFILGTFAKIDILGIILFIVGFNFIKFNKRDWVWGIGIFAFYVITYSVLRVSLVDYFLPIDILDDSKLAITTFTENPVADLTGFLISIYTYLQVIFIYIGKILMPIKLCYYYGYNYYQLDTAFSLKLFFLFLIFVSIIIGVLFLAKKNRFILISGIGFLSFIFFATGFITAVAGIVADRYVFMALPWFIMLFVFVLTHFLPIQNIYTKGIFVCIVVLLTTASFIRAKAWENLSTLIETDVPKLHNSYEGMRIATNIYIDNFKATNDTSYLNKGIQCALNANHVYEENVLINTQLGQLLFLKNDFTNAEKYFKKAYSVDSTNVSLLEFLGDLYYSKKDYINSENYYYRAYQFATDRHKQALINNISTIYYEQGLKEKSLNYNFDLIRKDSLNFAAYENLGYYYLMESDTNKAKVYFNLAVKFGMPTEGIPSIVSQ
ncbi:MAG: hypothetical protein H6552_07060 [Chitinophagales bacterium]|nr:hypothetical protein [Chitinophagales bacterium]